MDEVSGGEAAVGGREGGGTDVLATLNQHKQEQIG